MNTALHDAHREHGARMVDFAGWQMPVQYRDGLVAEHKRVRSAAGIFDVSHMGQLSFRGPDAVAMVDRLITNDLASLPDGKAQYTTICNDRGTILDDGISYRLSPDHVMMVVNASNVDKIAAWVAERAEGDSEWRNESAEWSLLAVQGPRAMGVVEAVMPETTGMGPFEVRAFDSRFVATTGYTGELGCEVFVPNDAATDLWNAVLDAGASIGLAPVGLGARDTLRLESRLCLYGNDIDETTNPIEAGLGWVVKVNKPGGFIGRDALVKIKAAKTKRRLVGLQVTGRGIARQGHTLHTPDGERVGQVTSGTRSPTLEIPIALGYVDKPSHEIGTQLHVDIRGRRVEAEVVKTPFYRRGVPGETRPPGIQKRGVPGGTRPPWIRKRLSS